MASSIFRDSDAISQKDAFSENSIVEPIQKEESSNFTCSFMIPTQARATSEDNSEKSNNPEAFFSSISKCNVPGILSMWRQFTMQTMLGDGFMKILEWLKKSLEMETVDTVFY